ncbi:fructokinase [Listeria grandensis FSL F6-0971]|uniref:Fructokinase n=1 Tax=Listeria grandensis FSL F6-0971 TaxID=1265819 RepID=W7BPS3_9LIST|nr:fructokinase [Listeria grandensis FSL F6-0971]
MRKSSPTYGYITSTPKLAWRNYDIVGALKKKFLGACWIYDRCECSGAW